MAHLYYEEYLFNIFCTLIQIGGVVWLGASNEVILINELEVSTIVWQFFIFPELNLKAWYETFLLQIFTINELLLSFVNKKKKEREQVLLIEKADHNKE